MRDVVSRAERRRQNALLVLIIVSAILAIASGVAMLSIIFGDAGVSG